MNIDLFLTPYGESGLLCDSPLGRGVAGIILDAQTLDITLEFSSGDTLHLNIPIEEEHRDMLLFSHRMFVSSLSDGRVAETAEVPLMYLNDPYGGSFGGGSPILKKPRLSLVGFEQFMKRAVAAQPIHREDLGDEQSSACVLRGMNPAALQYVPQLVRQRLLEVAPKIPVTPAMMPVMNGPGGMGAGSGTSFARPIRPKTGQGHSDLPDDPY
ncbi:MAG: hypothetical protein J0L77_06675 [Alphaproteobacteria bacterium]|nr:hypothetical protein [Alphaproteobacteria bacterium]